MLSTTIFLASVISGCFTASTEQRLDFLELRFENELNKTDTDIKEIKEMIKRLNASEYQTCTSTTHEGGNETELEMSTSASFPDASKDTEKMDKKMKHVFDHVEKNSQALMDEFEKTLTVLRKQHRNINEKINTNKVAIGLVREELSVHGKSNGDTSEKLKRNDFRIGKFENKLSVLDDIVNDLRKKLESYNEKLVELEQRLTKLDKKGYDIGEDMERSYLTVGNIDHKLVEMDSRYHDFVGDLNKFKKDIKQEIEELTDKLQTKPAGRKVTQKTCPISWIQHGQMCYLYDKETGEDWASAVSMCHSLGAKLAEPDSREEMDYLRGFAHGWIGASDVDNEGVFVWESSKNAADLPWWPGMPDNYGGDQDCVSIWGSMINDEDCSKRYRYVCEKRLE